MYVLGVRVFKVDVVIRFSFIWSRVGVEVKGIGLNSF